MTLLFSFQKLLSGLADLSGSATSSHTQAGQVRHSIGTPEMLASCVAVALGAVAPSDLVTSLPTYGPLKTKQYAGYAAATNDGENKLFYWFAECDCGSKSQDVPLLLWLNGGPGASSSTGLLIEKLGPQLISDNATLVDNPDRITTDHHLLIFDNPVGSGYSSTSSKSYARSEFDVRTQFVHALRQFFTFHPEYAANPFYVTGESCECHRLSASAAAAVETPPAC